MCGVLTLALAGLLGYALKPATVQTKVEDRTTDAKKIEYISSEQNSNVFDLNAPASSTYASDNMVRLSEKSKNKSITISQVTKGTFSLFAMENSEYVLNNGVYARIVDALTGQKEVLSLVHNQAVYGDINNDGLSDMVVAFNYSAGGNGGNEQHIGFFLNKNGFPLSIGSRYVTNNLNRPKILINKGIITVIVKDDYGGPDKLTNYLVENGKVILSQAVSNQKGITYTGPWKQFELPEGRGFNFMLPDNDNWGATCCRDTNEFSGNSVFLLANKTDITLYPDDQYSKALQAKKPMIDITQYSPIGCPKRNTTCDFTEVVGIGVAEFIYRQTQLGGDGSVPPRKMITKTSQNGSVLHYDSSGLSYWIEILNGALLAVRFSPEFDASFRQDFLNRITR